MVATHFIAVVLTNAPNRPIHIAHQNIHLHFIPWESEHWINLDAIPQHASQFEKVSENQYIDILVCDTIWEVDYDEDIEEDQ